MTASLDSYGADEVGRILVGQRIVGPDRPSGDGLGDRAEAPTPRRTMKGVYTQELLRLVKRLEEDERGKAA